MSEARANNLSNESSTGGPTITGITTFSGTNFFVPPVGSTIQRPDNPQKGAIRFNTDTAHLEYYRGDTIGWSEVEASNEELDGGYRGLFAGGLTPSLQDIIDYITISTLGNTTDFGDINAGKQSMAACASRTRALNLGGYTSSFENEIEYVTIAQLGNTQDFGDLTQSKNRVASCSTQTRGISAGGNISGGSTNVIEYVTIASTGNGVDFGDSTRTMQSQGGLASSVRGVFAGGYQDTSPGSVHWFNTIDYITIATTGNAIDFGDLPTRRMYAGSCSNSTRGVFAGGLYYPTRANIIEYITIATTGNAVDFGDLTNKRSDLAAASSPTRGVFCGGDTPSFVNTIDYVQIMTLGDALDFGDQTVMRDRVSGCSNGHGGL